MHKRYVHKTCAHTSYIRRIYGVYAPVKSHVYDVYSQDPRTRGICIRLVQICIRYTSYMHKSGHMHWCDLTCAYTPYTCDVFMGLNLCIYAVYATYTHKSNHMHSCDLTRAYMNEASFVCDTTHFYVTRLIPMCPDASIRDTTHSYVTCDGRACLHLCAACCWRCCWRPKSNWVTHDGWCAWKSCSSTRPETTYLW